MAARITIYIVPPMRRPLAALTLCALAACSSGSLSDETAPSRPAIREGGTDKPKKLVFGLPPFLAEDELRREYAGLVQYLSSQVGVPTELRVTDSYAEVASALARFEVHLAILPPLIYVQAKRDNPGLILLATQIVDGSSTYAAYILTRDDSGIGTVTDLKGKRFAYVDRQSTSGYLYPLAYLRSMGVEPDSFFGSVVFAGSHDRMLDMLIKKQIDAGATYSTAYKLETVDNPEGKRLRILAKTGRIPLDAYCASPRLSQEIVDRARAALLGLSTRTEEGRRVLHGLSAINGFVAVGDDHYDEVRRVARLIEGTP